MVPEFPTRRPRRWRFLAAAASLCLLWMSAGPARAGTLPTDWERFESTHITVHAPSGSARAGERFAGDADDVMDELLDLTGQDSPRAHLHAYLPRTRESFAAIQPGDPPAWAAGTAYPDKGLIFVLLSTSGEKTPRHVFAHEVAHVVLHWRFGEDDPPRWLDEGLAQVAAGEFDLGTGATLTRAAVGGGLIPLSSLTRRFPTDPTRARIAYAESRDFVLFLRHRYGDEAVAEVVASMADGASADEALAAATGRSFADLEDSWASRLKRRYGWLPVLGGSGTFWSLAAVLLVAGWARRKRIRRRKLAEMGAAEQALDERRAEAWPPDEAGRPLWRDPDRGPPTTIH